MTLDRSHVHLAKITLEAVTPLSIGLGKGHDLFDNFIVRDANGLPAIPGSSFAGVLRHLYMSIHGADIEAQELFGVGSAPENHEDDGGRFGSSRVQVSWGTIHDSRDRPVEGLLLGDDLKRLTDPLLASVLERAPLKRDHVRIDCRGSAEDKGQFDRVSLPAGYRFSLELSLWRRNQDREAWHDLIELLWRPELRLGGRTRGGLGAVRIVRLHQESFNLRDENDFDAFANLSPDLDDVSGLQPMRVKEVKQPPVQALLGLKPEDFFRFGQGDHSFGEESRVPDLLSLSERIVVWQTGPDGQDHGKISERLLVMTASSVKGALRHRFAYHYNAETEFFADQKDPAEYATEQNRGVAELFGSATDSDEGKDGENRGHAGKLMLDDVYRTPEAVSALWHNGIDRFTGGVRNHVLYAEEVVSLEEPFHLRLTILAAGKISGPVRKALGKTLEDLVRGRLGLGAGSGRGHGFFEGKIDWSDDGAWLEGGAL